METARKEVTPFRDIVGTPLPLISQHQKVDLHIPFTTYLKLVSCILLAWAACYLWPLALLTLLAAMVAVTLDFFVGWIEKRGAKHWVALTMVISVFILSILGAIGWMLPMMVGQMADVAKDLPHFKDELVKQMPGEKGFKGRLSNTSTR